MNKAGPRQYFFQNCSCFVKFDDYYSQNKQSCFLSLVCINPKSCQYIPCDIYYILVKIMNGFILSGRMFGFWSKVGQFCGAQGLACM